MRSTSIPMNLTVAPGFEPVAEAFKASFEAGEEIGATFAVMHRGQLVVDLTGGFRDSAREQPLEQDDLFAIWSTTKGLAALCIAIAVDRDQLSYEQTVASVWPSFADGGKADVNIGMLLSHASGICGPDQPATWDDLLDQMTMAERLAAQAPAWPPGSASAYNANIFGHWVEALLRHGDGRGTTGFFEDHVAAPLGADVWIGLPPEQHDRRVEMVAPWSAMVAAMPLPQDPLVRMATANPRGEPLVCNDPYWIEVGPGAVGASANSRGLATVYGALANGGILDGVRIISEAGLARATALQREGKDRVLGLWARWAAGFLLSNRGLYGDNPNAFGHSGWGGSFAFADPDRQLALAYTPNLMAPNLSNDPRGRRLMEAVFACLGG